jgi:hypothetical protein
MQYPHSSQHLVGLNWHCLSARSELGKNNHEEKKLSKGFIPFNGQNVQLGALVGASSTL